MVVGDAGMSGTAIVVDDHALVRYGICQLAAQEGLATCEAESFGRLIALLADPAIAPDLVLLDLALPDMDGMASASALRRAYPALPILVITARTELHVCAALSVLGIEGLAYKDCDPHELGRAIREIARGGTCWPAHPAIHHARSAAARLTGRQKNVLLLCAAGYGDEEIAETLKISASTVRVHLAQVFRALGTSRFHEPVARAPRPRSYTAGGALSGTPARD